MANFLMFPLINTIYGTFVSFPPSLSIPDSRIFADALLNPPEPAERLRQAAEDYEEQS